MRLWKMELYKILRRPVLNFGLFLIMVFQCFIFWMDVSGKQTEIDGNIYKGISAIQADRALTEDYEGLFTLNKAEQIVERFGFSAYKMERGQKVPGIREGNFCSQWVTDNLTDFNDTGTKPAALKEGEVWKERGQQYLDKKIQFGYTEGWAYFHSLWSWSVLFLNVWVVLMVMPVFSEEYSRKTVNVLLATVHGKGKDIWAKMWAALVLGIAAFLVITFWLLILTVAVYGATGIDASAGMFDYRALAMESESITVLEHLLQTFGAKLAAVCLNVCMTLLFSSKCRNTASAVVLRLVSLYPFAWVLNEVVYSLLLDMMYDSGMIHYLWGWITLDILGIICSSTTYYLSWSAVIGVPQNWKIIVKILLFVVMSASIWRTAVNYRKGNKTS